jgi:hypothetical protein
MDKQAVASEIQGLIETGRDFHQRGWSLATSSNYSVVTGRDPLRLLVTCSGLDKGRLTPETVRNCGRGRKKRVRLRAKAFSRGAVARRPCAMRQSGLGATHAFDLGHVALGSGCCAWLP